LSDWPADRERPAASVLYEWLNRAFDEKLVQREGTGRRGEPYRYRLVNENEGQWDRGERPPVRELEAGVVRGQPVPQPQRGGTT
jgi:hypothetical protein